MAYANGDSFVSISLSLVAYLLGCNTIAQLILFFLLLFLVVVPYLDGSYLTALKDFGRVVPDRCTRFAFKIQIGTRLVQIVLGGNVASANADADDLLALVAKRIVFGIVVVVIQAVLEEEKERER